MELVESKPPLSAISMVIDSIGVDHDCQVRILGTVFEEIEKLLEQV